MRKKTERPLSSRLSGCLAVAAVCSTTVLGGGCKSSMPTWKTPSWSSFGLKKEPSSDALAGVGPTATYPLSPSAAATPSAIQSVAAAPSGMQPQTSQVATSANPAAAAANGFAAQPPTGPGVAPSTSYVHGKNPVGPPTAGLTAPMPTYATAGTTTRPPASNYAAVGYPMPGTAPSAASPSAPVSASIASTPAPNPVPASAAISGGSATPPSLAGFAMPTSGAPTNAPASPPTTGGFVMPTQTPVAQSSPTPPAGGFVMPALAGQTTEDENAPDARTASATDIAPKTAVGGATPAGAYSPGSTSGATSYPTNSAGVNGTFYR